MHYNSDLTKNDSKLWNNFYRQLQFQFITVLQMYLSPLMTDQSLRCPCEETLGSEIPTEHTAKTLIRPGGCPG